ncbi:hypothetical protein Aglo01_35010 [Actinokineospora globicatena]|nr:hypothetical protein Aglo01_35010 [Actinokineospora globicatena]GLW86570.1 hypothetical protein Aglo02_42090 [Actinokineospora globicatena]
MGFTQETLAEALRVERSTVARWESGNQAPMPGIRRRLADALTVPLHELVALLEVGPVQANLDLEPVGVIDAHLLTQGVAERSQDQVPQDRETHVGALGWHAGPGGDVGDGLPGRDTVESVLRLGGADVDRREFLASAAVTVAAAAFAPGDPDAIMRLVARMGGVRVGAGEVAAIRTMTTALGDTASELGGAHARHLVVRYLVDDVGRWLDGAYTEAVGRELVTATAELVHLAGWMARDAGENGVAQRYYLHSYRLANEAGAPEVAATSLRGLADQALDLGYTGMALRFAGAADQTGRHLGEPKARAYYATTHARAAAADSDFATARARLSVAGSAMDRAVDTPGLSWAGHYSPGRWAHEAALVHARMGDMLAAEEHIDHALSLGLDRRRTRAMVLADLGGIRFRREDADGAVAAWTEFAGLAEGVHSTRIDRSAADIAVRLGSVAGEPAAHLRDLLAQRSPI